VEGFHGSIIGTPGKPEILHFTINIHSNLLETFKENYATPPLDIPTLSTPGNL
jgi:hypothetical protein